MVPGCEQAQGQSESWWLKAEWCPETSGQCWPWLAPAESPDVSKCQSAGRSPSSFPVFLWVRNMPSFIFQVWVEKITIKTTSCMAITFHSTYTLQFSTNISRTNIYSPWICTFRNNMRYHKYFTLANKVPFSTHKHFFPPAFTLFTQILDWSSLFWVSMSQCALINYSLQYTHDAEG